MAEDFFDVPGNQLPQNIAQFQPPISLTPQNKMKTASTLEDLAIDSYLKYLEGEVVAYISLTQTESALLRGVAVRMMATLKDQLNSRMSGIASSLIRQKMLKIILSDRFPSPQHCNVYIKRSRKTNDVQAHQHHIAIAAAVAAVGIQPAAIAVAANVPQNNPELNNVLPPLIDGHVPPPQPLAVGHGAVGEANLPNQAVPNAEDNYQQEDIEQVYSNCPNTCCTGAFIQEAMAGVIMSADIRELIFTSEQVSSRRSSSFSCLEFNIPVVLTHLLSATHQHFSQLERLIFSENFVKEDSSISSLTEEEASTRLRLLQHQDPIAVLEHQYRRQDRFAKHFAAVTTQAANGSHNSVYCSADRKGLALGLLVMFRDVAPRSPLTGDLIGFYKLSEIVLKNNVQCELYSKANFQFELLARIGFCCPRLKVLDLFGTDTWADCLVAFFFRDAFHSLHRYLFFMENEEDEDSAYHPHDLTRYCQFCLDRLHPVAVERPFTINPVIPLIDPIYDHVIKKYPKRSYCILRNCVKVSDLVQCPKSTVYELLRPTQSHLDPLKNKAEFQTCSSGSSDNKQYSDARRKTQLSGESMYSDPSSNNEVFNADFGDIVNQEESVMDDIIAENSSLFNIHDSDTIRSRLRSATKTVNITKNNRSRGNLKGTRQNQEPIHIRAINNELLPSNSNKSAFKDSESYIKSKSKNKFPKNDHGNWKKRCLRGSENVHSLECNCCLEEEDKSRKQLKDENSLSKILSENTCSIDIGPCQISKTLETTSRKRGKLKRNIDFSKNDDTKPCNDVIVQSSIIRRRRSSRLINKCSKQLSSKSLRNKVPKMNTKKIFATSKQCTCSDCSSSKIGENSGDKLSSIESMENEGGSTSETTPVRQRKCKNKLKFENSPNLTSNKVYKVHSQSENDSPLKSTESHIGSNEAVMTRLMRKRKNWLERDKLKVSANNISDRLVSDDRVNIEIEESCSPPKYLKTEDEEGYSVEVLDIDIVVKDFKRQETSERNKLANDKKENVLKKSLSQTEVKTITFEEWQKEASNKWAAYTSNECECSTWQNGAAWSNSSDNQKTGTGCSQERNSTTSHSANKSNTASRKKNENMEKISSQQSESATTFTTTSIEEEWSEPKDVRYREISGWPHLNDCIQTLEVMNIGGTNVLGEFIPFILLYAPRLKSLGQWINTMIYGLEIFRQLPGQSKSKFLHIEEFSYSTDRNYFCQPYIGFVPESNEYRNVRKEMVRQSAKVAKRLGHSVRNHAAKRQQIEEDVRLMVDACPNVHKLNLVLHHKLPVLDEADVVRPWSQLVSWTLLKELDLVTMRFSNVRTLLKVVGPQLLNLTLEMDDEQGSGSEIVHIARHCPELRSLRLLIGDKILRGEMALNFWNPHFRHLERLTVEGSVHLHCFAFLWGHCRNLTYLRIGNVVSNEVTTTNVLIYDVFTLMFQVNKMEYLEEMHIKNLKIRSLQMGQFLLENLPKLKKASNWLLDIYGQDLIEMKRLISNLKRSKSLMLEFREW